MRIISKQTLVRFWTNHPNAQSPLRVWYTRVNRGRWRNFVELRQIFPSADQVGRLTVFNIGGGNYRLIVRVEYELQRVYIRHVLTHADYDRGNWKNDEWF